MQRLFAAVGAFDAASEALGLGVAALLLLIVRLTLPERARAELRLPFWALVLHVVALALAHALPKDSGAREVLGPIALGCLLVSAARSGVLLVLDVALGRRLMQPIPQISRDIIQGLAYAAVGIAILRAIGLEPASLLTTSALLTAVIGLSLQETLGNLFAGVAIQMQRPFDVGDWIQFDAELKHIGRVIEINWRATKVITLDEVELIVPNASLAKAPITNFTKPTTTSRRSLYVTAPYDVPPAEVHATILAALRDVQGVRSDPKPTVVTNLFADRGVEYWVRFFTDEFHRRDVLDGVVRDRIWYALHRGGIAIPYPSHNVDLREVSEASRAARTRREVDARTEALRAVDFFQILNAEDQRALGEMTHERLFLPGEVVVREGDSTSELFIVERGALTVSIARGKAEVAVAELAAGQFFGEMALMTGDVRHATVRAKTACALLEVPRDALKRILEGSPDLAGRISEVLANRQAELEAKDAESKRPTRDDLEQRTSLLLDKVRRFFAL